MNKTDDKTRSEMDALERNALEQALSATDPKQREEALRIAHAVAQRRKLEKELVKMESEAKERSKLGRAKVWAGVLTPLLAVALTGATLILNVTGKEESLWCDAVNRISIKTPADTMVSAFSMQNYFDSKHGDEARILASTLLPYVDNPDGFDHVFFNLLHKVDSTNQVYVAAIGRALLSQQMDVYRLPVLVNRPGVADSSALGSMLGDEELPDEIQQDQENRRKAQVNAWMLGSVSDGLRDLWGSKKAAPKKLELSGVVLEHGDFTNLDFSSANMKGGAVYDCNFGATNLSGAQLSRKVISHVTFDKANLSEIKDFERSKWEHSNWWKANCISSELLTYLEANDATATDSEKQEAYQIRRTCLAPENSSVSSSLPR